MDFQISIKDAKSECHCKTTILDKYSKGWLTEMYTITLGKESRSVYKVNLDGQVFLLKSSYCPFDDTELILKLKNEYHTALISSSATSL